jgi:prephenate dehydrogenase
MGTSVAMALAAAGHEVHLGDVDPDVGTRAVAHAHVHRWVAGESPEVDARVELAIAAVPPDATAAVLIQLLSLNAELTVSDLCSVKERPLGEVEAAGADVTRLVGGHPVAGRELSGPESGLATLFEDRSWVLCPGPTTSDRAMQRTDRAVRDCGATPIVMSASEHDRVLATVSHMPQVVASVVAGALLGLDGQDLRLAGPGVRDVTRIAASSPGLWRQILEANADAVRAVLSEVADALAAVASAPVGEFAGRAAAVIHRGNAGRALLPEKGARPVSWRWVQAAVPDAPGELGRLFIAVGATGINIEDLRVRHADGGGSGWALMAVDVLRADELSVALTADGWSVEVHDEDGDADVFR